MVGRGLGIKIKLFGERDVKKEGNPYDSEI
jgi:hypothetical protein